MENKFLKFVDFKNIESWSTYAILGSKFDYSNHFELSKIREFLKRNKTQVSIENEISYKRPTIKINGQGIFLRDIKVGTEIGTKNQFRIKEGQFLLSKIDARNGAFGVVPKELDNGIITGNFWTFDVDYDKINPHFLTLVTKTKQFQNLSQSASVGTTNRNYLQEEEFLNFQIPLPTLSEQEAIVSAYQAKILAAQELEQQSQNLENQIENYLFEELGIEQVQEKKEKVKGLQFVEFKDVEKWGLDFIFGNEKRNNKYSIFKISELCKISSGGTPSRSRKEYFQGNIPWIKTGELNNEILFDTEEKITEEAIQNSSAKLYPIGSLVVAMYGATIGKTAKLGVEATTNQACAVLFDINKEKVEVDFLWEFIQSQTNKFKLLAYGSAQPNLNAGIISNYEVPLPSLGKQDEIVSQIKAMKQTQKEQTQTAIRLREEALQEFESVIFE